MGRNGVGKTKRKIIFERDCFECKACGWSIPKKPENYTGDFTLSYGGKWLEIDHINPVINGGRNDLNNLQTLCNSCNCKKGSKRSV